MHYTKFLKWGVLAGLVLTLFVSFIVAAGGAFPAMFFPYITGKNFAFRILVELTFGLYVLLAIREPKYRPKSSLLMWAVCLFVGWIGLATIFSVDPIKSFWSNFERMDGYITVIHLFAYFLVTSAVLTAEKWWDKFFQISVSASILQGLYALAQVFHIFGLAPSSQSGVRADGTFGNATYLAVYMMLNFFITLLLLAGLFKEKNAWRNSQVLIWFYGIAAVIQFLAIFLTETRGTILGLVGGLIIAALYIVVRGVRGPKNFLFKGAVGMLVLVVVLVGAFFALKSTPIVQNTPGLSRLSTISLNDSTTKARLFYIWPMAIKGAMEKPILGWGQENFSFVFNKYYNPAMYGQEQWFDRAHNEFLDWFVAAGVPAFLLYISLFVLAAIAIIRSKHLSHSEQALLLGVLAAYGFNNLFVFDNLLSLMYFYMLLAFAHGMSSRELPKWAFMTKPGDDKIIAVAAPIVAVLIFGGFWMLNVPAMSRAQTLIDALQPQNPKTGANYSVEDHLKFFENALTQGELGRQETVEQLYQFASNSIAASQSVSPAAKQQAYDLTLAAGKALMEQRKNDARLELFLGVFYSQFGNYKDAIAAFEKSLSDSPNKQQILFQTGVVYLQQGDVQNAFTLFKKAYDLEPQYPDARILYATGLYYAKQNAEADKLLTDGFGSVLYDDNRLLQTYMSLKMYDRAIAIWQNRVKAAPTDTQTLLGLAGAYFASGNNSQTIATLKQVEELDPTSKAQMDSIIAQIQSGALKP
jgi:tetratricopeptide (TPR) repeat protein/O-antigen ligase